ncbi:MAG: hypothetical protein HY688_00300, partial [Chloroflexi bacterium]|nr:hypothetical protein [Chloroflexota bacterium]
VTSDVLDYTIPDDLTVAFFFNPFSGATFATVMDNIRDSLARRPRDLRIIYVNPTMHGALIQRGFLLFKRARGVWMYRNAS